MLNTDALQRLATRYIHGFILAFHEISPAQLAKFVDCTRAFQAVHLSELVRRTKDQKSTSGLFAITIDDGVGDNVRALAQLFRDRSWPATFYLPTEYVTTGEGMVFQWWERLKSRLPRRRLEVKSGTLDLTHPGAVDELSKRFERQWHTQRLESYLPMMMELADVVVRETGVPRELLKPAAPISWPEVAELSKNDLIRFESHGVSHAAMSSLTGEELASELRRSRNLVTEHTGRQCRHLAYPFGSRQSIGMAAAAAPRFYDSAVTMSLGHVDSASPWLLPRIPLYAANPTLFAPLKVVLKCGFMSARNTDPSGRRGLSRL